MKMICIRYHISTHVNTAPISTWSKYISNLSCFFKTGSHNWWQSQGNYMAKPSTTEIIKEHIAYIKNQTGKFYRNKCQIPNAVGKVNHADASTNMAFLLLTWNINKWKNIILRINKRKKSISEIIQLIGRNEHVISTLIKDLNRYRGWIQSKNVQSCVQAIHWHKLHNRSDNLCKYIRTVLQSASHIQRRKMKKFPPFSSALKMVESSLLASTCVGMNNDTR